MKQGVVSSQRLVRYWPEGFGGASVDAFVDWVDGGRFSIDCDHPLARSIWDTCGDRRGSLTVLGTDEVEWHVDSVSSDSFTHQYRVLCVSHRDRLRRVLKSDEYRVELWLAAEKRWRAGETLVEELAADAFDAWYCPPCTWRGSDVSETVREFWRERARKLLDSGWCKDVSSG